MVIYPTYLMFFVPIQSKVQSSPKCQLFTSKEQTGRAFSFVEMHFSDDSITLQMVCLAEETGELSQLIKEHAPPSKTPNVEF